MSNADKILCPVEPQGDCLCHVAHMQCTSASLCVCTSVHTCLWGAEFTHAYRCMCTSPPVALVQACAGWGLARLWHCLYALPICRECLGARWGRMAWKPLPVAVPSFREATRWHPAHRACLPLHLSPELPGRPQEAQPPAPSLQPRRPESTAHTHTMQGCAAHFLPHRQKPSQSEPEENQAEQSLQVEARQYAHGSHRESRCPYGSLPIVGISRHGGSVQQVIELGECLHYPDDHTCTDQNTGEHASGFLPLCGCLHRPGSFKVWDLPASGCLRMCLCLCSVGVYTLPPVLHTVGG